MWNSTSFATHFKTSTKCHKISKRKQEVDLQPHLRNATWRWQLSHRNGVQLPGFWCIFGWFFLHFKGMGPRVFVPCRPLKKKSAKALGVQRPKMTMCVIIISDASRLCSLKILVKPVPKSKFWAYVKMRTPTPPQNAKMGVWMPEARGHKVPFFIWSPLHKVKCRAGFSSIYPKPHPAQSYKCLWALCFGFSSWQAKLFPQLPKISPKRNFF